jgi:hypothetical protein
MSARRVFFRTAIADRLCFARTAIVHRLCDAVSRISRITGSVCFQFNIACDDFVLQVKLGWLVFQGAVHKHIHAPLLTRGWGAPYLW